MLTSVVSESFSYWVIVLRLKIVNHADRKEAEESLVNPSACMLTIF